MYYLRNRWYDPILARFISEDPIRLPGVSTADDRDNFDDYTAWSNSRAWGTRGRAVLVGVVDSGSGKRNGRHNSINAKMLGVRPPVDPRRC